MKRWPEKTTPLVITLLGAAFLAGTGCVEPLPIVPNSDQGKFFVDNELAIAQGWQSHIVLVGPQTGRQHCDRATGLCYADHQAIELTDVVSLDPEMVDVVEFGEHQLGEVKGGRVLVSALEEGTVKLEATATIGEESVVDTFNVRVAPVAKIDLAMYRPDPVAPYSRHAFCAPEVEALYLVDGIEGLAFDLTMTKRDQRGKVLRGHGQFPITVEPSEAAELTDGEEALSLIRVIPRQQGRIKLKSQKGSSEIAFHFARQGDVNAGLATVFRRDASGQRLAEVGELIQGQTYDFAVFPLVGQVPLCGGDARVVKQNLTPTNCSFVGSAHPGSDQVVQTTQPGECHIVFNLVEARAGQGLRFDLRVDVLPGEYGEQPGW
jgi:hypothetical protein